MLWATQTIVILQLSSLYSQKCGTCKNNNNNNNSLFSSKSQGSVNLANMSWVPDDASVASTVPGGPGTPTVEDAPPSPASDAPTVVVPRTPPPPSPRSHPPTELDSESARSDVASSDDNTPSPSGPAPAGPAPLNALPLLPAAPLDAPLVHLDTVVPYRHYNRMMEVLYQCSYLDNLYWALAPPGADMPQHIDTVLDAVLDDTHLHFKIGITFRPHDRLYTYRDYYRWDRRMYIIGVSESSQVIADYEDDAILSYSLAHTTSGQAGCRNLSRGFLGAHHGMSPFFLYIVIGNRDGWHGYPPGENRCNRDVPRPWAPHFAAWHGEQDFNVPPSAAAVNATYDRAVQTRRTARRRQSRSRSPRTAGEPG